MMKLQRTYWALSWNLSKSSILIYSQAKYILIFHDPPNFPPLHTYPPETGCSHFGMATLEVSSQMTLHTVKLEVKKKELRQSRFMQ